MYESEKFAHLVAHWGLKSSHSAAKLVKAERAAGGTAGLGVSPAMAPQCLHRGLAFSAASGVLVASGWSPAPLIAPECPQWGLVEASSGH